ncbi:hypothetical protein H6P81_007288 [Aristolochia fimbriata]|uniref:E3 ubiquitin-protein ligase RMA n=1 Tax=Aristolochia fimbriata TaxID=158543 RepID=A0AAV7F0V3_ARIFI|nr:hypothetical protein H6P81_007288 [Aristolochia fimbriata]
MPNGGNESRSRRRMDLNLYLGLPRSPIRPVSDLGSDLALGSITLSTTEVRGSSEMANFVDASATHAPYSPTRASFTPSSQAVEPVEGSLQFDFSEYSPRPSVQIRREVLEDRSLVEYSPYSPSYVTPSSAEEARVEPLENVPNERVHHVPYSPSYVPGAQDNPEPVVDESNANNHVEYVPYSPVYSPIQQPVGAEQVEEPFVIQDGGPHAPYSPSYVAAENMGQLHDGSVPTQLLSSGAPFTAPYEPSGHRNEPSDRGGTSERDLLEYPEVRFRRLIEVHNRRWPIRRFRSTVPYSLDTANTESLSPSHIFQELMASDVAAEASDAQKVDAVEQVSGETEEEAKQENVVANFECNICLDMAKEPVVTSCGHLFCWPCLYQWLHLHSDHKECPVCKGEVTESNITPIYGRGKSESDGEKKSGGQDSSSGVKVPPRPRGYRLESLRQRIRRPLSRGWFGDEISSWRRFVDEEIRNGSRVEGSDGRTLQGIFDSGSRRVLTRLRAIQRLQREENSNHGLNLGAGPSRNPSELVLNSQNRDTLHGESPAVLPFNTSFLHEGIDFWRRISLYTIPPPSERIAALTAGLIERISGGGSHSGGSPSVNPPTPEPPRRQAPQGVSMAADQASASASSTMAVIQGDAGVSNASIEANDVGTSRAVRRRRRNVTLGSLDVDGVHPARKRRRLN